MASVFLATRSPLNRGVFQVLNIVLGIAAVNASKATAHTTLLSTNRANNRSNGNRSDGSDRDRNSRHDGAASVDSKVWWLVGENETILYTRYDIDTMNQTWLEVCAIDKCKV